MTDFKSSANRLVKFFQSSRDKWKKRAIDRHKENRALKVKIRDLENSRKKWKNQAKNSSDIQKKSVEENNTKPSDGKKELKNQSSKDISVERSVPIEGELIRAPKGHTYSTQVILWSLEISVNIYASLRGTHKILTLFNPLFGYQVPSYTSISNGGYRLGLHILQQPIEFREDWIIVLDETTQLDTNKALIILGIPLEQLKKKTGYSPSHHDMQLIDIRILTHSNGNEIKEILEETSDQIGEFLQIVSDHGSDIKKGVDLYQQAHSKTVCTYDVSHYAAILLKKELGNDERWLSFLSQCSQARSQVQQTELAALKPPKQRTKARFMHTETHLIWAEKTISYYKKGDFSGINPAFSINWPVHNAIVEELGQSISSQLAPIHGLLFENEDLLRQALGAHLSESQMSQLDDSVFQQASHGWRRWHEKFNWILDYEDDIKLYKAMIDRTKLLQTHLKQKGLAQGSEAKIKKYFEEQPISTESLNSRVQAVEKSILQYVKDAEKTIPKEKILLASSDIIESAFGKYKYLTEKSPAKEVGKRILLIPVFLTQVGTALVQEAMETVRNVDVDQWVKKNCGTSMLAKCRKMLAFGTNDVT